MPCQVGTHLSRLRHLGWNQCSHGLSSRPLESCHHRCLCAVCGILGYPKGSAAELLDGALKLRCCTTPFSKRFPNWSLPPVGNGRVRSLGVATGHSVGEGGSIQRRGDGKDCALLPPKEWGVSPACLAIFFLDLELGEVFAPGDAWNLPSEGKGVGFLPAGQSSRRGWCAGTSPFN